MRVDKTREELEEKLILPTLSVKRKRNTVQEIKNSLYNNHKILEGNTQSWINNPSKELPELDWRLLYLFAKQIYLKTNILDINPDGYYTEIEAKKALQYTGGLTIESDIKLPLVFDDAVELGYGRYLTTISAKRLSQMSSTLLNYNFDIQREATKIRRNNETIKVATLVMQNVEEIKNHLKNDTLQPTMIVLNASVGSSDSGDEITYNPETKQMQINKGTVLDIVDGYHRCKGTELALNEKPEIDFNFALTVLNYTDEQAARYQGQLAEATPISKPKKNQLSAKRHADAVVKELMTHSELKDRVAVANAASIRNLELVTYDILADAIEEQFTLERKIDVYKVTEYLKNYFNILLGEFSEQFIEEPQKWKKKSLMVDHNMFIGYIVLAKKMYENNIEEIKVIDYIKNIDFNKSNPLWKKINVLNERLNLNKTTIVRKSIKRYFEEMKI